MNLCCHINPTKECKGCKGKFCPDHVFTEDPLYSSKPVKSECFQCYQDRVTVPRLASQPGMTSKELFLEVRKLVPKGYLNITFQVQEGQPGFCPFTTQWSIYHESHKSSVGATPEQALASFKAKVRGTPDPQLTPLDNVGF